MTFFCILLRQLRLSPGAGDLGQEELLQRVARHPRRRRLILPRLLRL